MKPGDEKERGRKHFIIFFFFPCKIKNRRNIESRDRKRNKEKKFIGKLNRCGNK